MNWLWIGPTGPHVVGDICRDIANLRDGCCFFIDLDPRFVKLLVAGGNHETFKAYIEHVERQAFAILDTQEVGVLGTTPALLQTLAPKLVEHAYSFQGVFYGGTHLTSDVYSLLRTQFFPNAVHAPGYGNTLMGSCIIQPWSKERGDEIFYYPFWPYFVIEVVDPNMPDRTLGYGVTGQVCFSTLSEELFLPRVLERDQASQAPPIPELGWDGIKDVRPLQSGTKTIIEGVY